MSWKAFRVRKGLHSDAKIKIDGDGSAGSAIENRGALSALTSPSLDSATTHDQGGAVLVLDNDKQISFRTGFELKEDIKSSVDVRAGFGIHFSHFSSFLKKRLLHFQSHEFVLINFELSGFLHFVQIVSTCGEQVSPKYEFLSLQLVHFTH